MGLIINVHIGTSLAYRHYEMICRVYVCTVTAWLPLYAACIYMYARARGVFIVLIKHSRKLVCLRRERTFTEKRIGAYICVTLQTKSRASQELIYISALLCVLCKSMSPRNYVTEMQ
jgi:hypothetical protein